jgi:hypothetical protein
MTLPAVSLGESSSTPTPIQTSMANLLSITETIPPGSPHPHNGSPNSHAQPPRTSSRGSQNSPSSGMMSHTN